MIRWPKPVSGSSPQAAWLNLLLEACKLREIKQIDGMDDQATSTGRVFKRKHRPPPPSSAAPAGATGLNFRGLWFADGLSGQAFSNGDVAVDDIFDFTQLTSDGFSVITHFPYQKAYVFTGGQNVVETVSPSSNLSVWRYVWPYLIEY